jgi:isopenicillin-N N-acyltransferase-like protein
VGQFPGLSVVERTFEGRDFLAFVIPGPPATYAAVVTIVSSYACLLRSAKPSWAEVASRLSDRAPGPYISGDGAVPESDDAQAAVVTLAVAHAAGSPRAMGRAQGEAFAEGIDRACSFYRRLALSHGTELGELGERALPYVQATRARLPTAVDELDGLVEGAGITREEGYALNCFEETWAAIEACTTAVHDRFLIHAEQWYAGHSDVGVVVALPGDGPAFVSPTCAGFLPAVGMSSSGFAQGIDSLPSIDDCIGIPRVLVSRASLGARGIAAAAAAACTRGRAGGYAHVLASRDRSLVVETTAGDHRTLEPATAHTNHFLGPLGGHSGATGSAGSRARLARAAELLAADGPRSLDDCARLLSDHGPDGRGRPDTICVHDDGLDADATVFGMACDLESGTMIVSDGPPCRGAWQEFAVPDFAYAHGVV